MKKWTLLAAFAAAAAMLFSPALMAQDAPAAPKSDDKPAEKPKEPEKAPEGEKKEEPKKEESAFAKMFKGIEEVIGKVEAAEADFKAFLKHYPEVDKLTEADEKFKKLRDGNLKDAFEYIVKNEKYVAWAKEKEVDADKFMRMALRIVTIHIKVNMKDTFKEAEKGIEDGMKELEAMRDQIPAEDYKKAIAEMEKAKQEMADMKKVIEGLPAPTDAEKKLLEANAKEISKAMGEGGGEDDDSGDDEKEDGMGGK